MTYINYINLTNGIQAIKDYGLKEYRFIRIQSTHCEQKRWEDILNNLSDDFLMNVALGNKCIIYDYGAKKDTPRAIWQGLEFIKFILNKLWYNIDYTLVGRSKTSKNYFNSIKINEKIIIKLCYYKKFLNGKIDIQSITSGTDKDGKIDFYNNIIKGE